MDALLFGWEYIHTPKETPKREQLSAAVASPLIQNFKAWKPSNLSFPSTSSHQRISPVPQKVLSVGFLFSQIVTRFVG